jgi:dTDP-4-amino-4,6-dideoxygalactose transaminase
VGGLADVGAFSLNGTKVLAGPEGGLLTTADEAIFNRAAKVRVFGAQWKEGQRVIGDTDCLGYNYRMTEFVAAFTMARLRSFDREQAIRIENARRLIDGIRDLEGVVSPPDVPSDRTHIYQMVHVRLEPDRQKLANFRDRIVKALRAEGTNFWVWQRRPLPGYTVFQQVNNHPDAHPWSLRRNRKSIEYRIEDYPVALSLAQNSLYTASHYPPNSTELMDLYAEAFRKVWAHRDELARVQM